MIAHSYIYTAGQKFRTFDIDSMKDGLFEMWLDLLTAPFKNSKKRFLDEKGF